MRDRMLNDTTPEALREHVDGLRRMDISARAGMTDEEISRGLAGRFIVLDGPDGCGKSSQARMLMDWLQGRGMAAVDFRDPETTEIGEKIREILLSPAHEAMTTPM
jgi:polyphosphate kinase 2 (PPK2 family)